MACNKPNSGCVTQECESAPCVPADCMLEIGDCLANNANGSIFASVFCPEEFRSKYIALGFRVLNDNAGEFVTMLRLVAGTTCGINFSVRVRDNSGKTIGYAPHANDCNAAPPERCPERYVPPIRCENIKLPTGTFTNATVTINSQGCIEMVREGVPERYTPDECCGGGSSVGGGGGTQGIRGLPGAAATVAASPVVKYGNEWSFTNVGTSSAAVFELTVPSRLNANTPGSTTSGGYTGSIRGLRVEEGLVKALPPEIVTDVEVVKQGTSASLYQITAFPVVYGNPPGAYEITINLDGFYNDLKSKIDTTSQNLSTLTQTVATQNNQLLTLQNDVNQLKQDRTTMQQNLNTLTNTLQTLTNNYNNLLTRFNSHSIHPPP